VLASVAIGGILLLQAPASAQGAECTFNSSSGTVQVRNESTLWLFDGSTDGLEIWEDEGRFFGFLPVQCADSDTGEPANPSAANTDRVMVGGPGGLTTQPLTPGRSTSDESGEPEIEVTYGGSGIVRLEPATGEQLTGVALGARTGTEVGANLNALAEGPSSSDTDLVFTGSPSQVSVITLDGPSAQNSSFVSAAGGGHFDRGFPFTTWIFGHMGDDVLLGGPAPDRIYPGQGDDRVDGGGGEDLFGSGSFFTGAAPSESIRVDLRRRGPQRTGEGLDVLREIEGAIGTAGPDALLGDSDANLFRGNSGNDLIRGRAGQDLLRGDPETDEIHGGPGRDALAGGSGGADVLVGGRGVDFLDARDGFRDRLVSCGRGADQREDAQIDRRDPAPISC
jgi:Ca2+-binding RTX toxin-like protein